MARTKKLEFIFGDMATTFRPEDIEAIWKEWEAANPGKKADRDMSSKEFADACMKRLAANARPTRTVLHN
jgi:hypothetical protein